MKAIDKIKEWFDEVAAGIHTKECLNTDGACVCGHDQIKVLLAELLQECQKSAKYGDKCNGCVGDLCETCTDADCYYGKDKPTCQTCGGSGEIKLSCQECCAEGTCSYDNDGICPTVPCDCQKPETGQDELCDICGAMHDLTQKCPQEVCTTDDCNGAYECTGSCQKKPAKSNNPLVNAMNEWNDKPGPQKDMAEKLMSLVNDTDMEYKIHDYLLRGFNDVYAFIRQQQKEIDNLKRVLREGNICQSFGMCGDEHETLVKEIDRLKKALIPLYEHCKNNMQICGIVLQAKQALEGK